MKDNLIAVGRHYCEKLGQVVSWFIEKKDKEFHEENNQGCPYCHKRIKSL